jgi:hypothetical protein
MSRICSFLILTIFASIVLASSNVFAASCSVTSSCNPDNILMRLSAPSNALVGLWNDTSYTTYVCCDFTGTHNCTHEDVYWVSQIHGITNTILWLNDTKSALVEYPPILGGNYWNKHNRVCFSNLSCISASSSIGYDSNLPLYTTIFPIKAFSMTANTNARVGDFNSHPIKIYCGFTGCGDGVINKYDEKWEKCDDGTNNGKTCSATPGTTCQYCSSTCQIATCNGTTGICGSGCVGPTTQSCIPPPVPTCGSGGNLTCPIDCICPTKYYCSTGACSLITHPDHCATISFVWQPQSAYSISATDDLTVHEGDTVRLFVNTTYFYPTECVGQIMQFIVCRVTALGPVCYANEASTFIYGQPNNYTEWTAVAGGPYFLAIFNPHSGVNSFQASTYTDVYYANPKDLWWMASYGLISNSYYLWPNINTNRYSGRPYFDPPLLYVIPKGTPLPPNTSAPVVPPFTVTGTGTQSRTCNNDVWSDWSSCSATACELGYTLCNSICDVSSRYCVINNGIGVESRTCNNNVWSSWGSCILDTCNPGFDRCGNSCNISSRYCSIVNGTGIQSMTCNAGIWSAWSSCSAASCSPGYFLCGSACNPTSRICPIVNGIGHQIGSCSNGLWTWDSCKVSLCNPGYMEIPSTNTCGVWASCP